MTINHLHRADQVAIALAGLHADHALPAALVNRELADIRTLAIPIFTHRQHLIPVFGNYQSDNFLTFRHTDTAHSTCGSAHGANIALMETNHLAATIKEHNVLLTISSGRAHQTITLVQ